jgi:hypothetical protein
LIAGEIMFGYLCSRPCTGQDFTHEDITTVGLIAKAAANAWGGGEYLHYKGENPRQRKSFQKKLNLFRKISDCFPGLSRFPNVFPTAERQPCPGEWRREFRGVPEGVRHPCRTFFFGFG